MLEPIRSDTMAVIPIRAGSKGLRGKNLRLLADKPLYCHSVDQALRVIGQCSITTDIPDVLEENQSPSCHVVKRPVALAGDHTPIAPVLTHLFEHLKREGTLPGVAVLMQATSPLRRDEDVRGAISLYNKGGIDLVMSVVKTDSRILKYGFAKNDRFTPVSRPDFCFANRQSLPKMVRPNGAIYVFSPEAFLKNGNFGTHSIGFIEMPETYSIDIDTQADLEVAENILSQACFAEAS